MPTFDSSLYYEALVAGDEVPELCGTFFKMQRRERSGPVSAPSVRFLRLRGFELCIYRSSEDPEPTESIDLHDILNINVPSQVPRAAKYFRKYDGGFDLVTLRNGTLSFEIAARDQETFACFCALVSFKVVTSAASIIYLSDGRGGNGNEVEPALHGGIGGARSRNSTQGAEQRKMVRVFACLRGSMLLLYPNRAAAAIISSKSKAARPRKRSRDEDNGEAERSGEGNPQTVIDLADLRSVKKPSLQPEARQQGFDLFFRDSLHTFMECTEDPQSRQLCDTLTAWQSKQMLHISEHKEGVIYMKFLIKRDTAHGQGFGMVVTKCPSVEDGPAWPGKFMDHLRVTMLPTVTSTKFSRRKRQGGDELMEDGDCFGPAQTAGLRLNDAILMIDNTGHDGGILRDLTDVGALVKGKNQILVEVARLPLEANVRHPEWKQWNDPSLEKKYRVLGQVQDALRVRHDIHVDGAAPVKKLNQARKQSYFNKHASARKLLALRESSITEKKTRRKKHKKHGFGGSLGATSGSGDAFSDDNSAVLATPEDVRISRRIIREDAEEERKAALAKAQKLAHSASPSLPASSSTSSNTTPNRQKSAKTLPSGWRAFKDKKGRTYYGHRDGQVQWRHPGQPSKRASSSKSASSSSSSTKATALTAAFAKNKLRQDQLHSNRLLGSPVAGTASPFLTPSSGAQRKKNESQQHRTPSIPKPKDISFSSSSSSDDDEDGPNSGGGTSAGVAVTAAPSGIETGGGDIQAAVRNAMQQLSKTGPTPQQFMAAQRAKAASNPAPTVQTRNGNNRATQRAASINEIPLSVVNANLPPGWTAHRDSQNRTYFAHKNGTVQWHPPGIADLHEI